MDIFNKSFRLACVEFPNQSLAEDISFLAKMLKRAWTLSFVFLFSDLSDWKLLWTKATIKLPKCKYGAHLKHTCAGQEAIRPRSCNHVVSLKHKRTETSRGLGWPCVTQQQGRDGERFHYCIVPALMCLVLQIEQAWVSLIGLEMFHSHQPFL